jgi:hypothetical protein
VELVVFVVTVFAAQVTVTVAGTTPLVVHAASADEVGTAIAAAAPIGTSTARREIGKYRFTRMHPPLVKQTALHAKPEETVQSNKAPQISRNASTCNTGGSPSYLHNDEKHIARCGH